MRILWLAPTFALLTGCLAPGTRDPTRYPWDARNTVAAAPAPHPRIVARGMISPNPDWQPQAQPITSQNSYCVMAIEQESRSGIGVGNTGVMACSAPANPAPKPGRPR
jgi:hypothetical protein